MTISDEARKYFDNALKRFATKEDLKRFVTKDEFHKKIDESVLSLRVLIEHNSAKLDQLIEGFTNQVQKNEKNEKKLCNHEKRITTIEDIIRVKRPE